MMTLACHDVARKRKERGRNAREPASHRVRRNGAFATGNGRPPSAAISPQGTIAGGRREHSLYRPARMRQRSDGQWSGMAQIGKGLLGLFPASIISFEHFDRREQPDDAP